MLPPAELEVLAGEAARRRQGGASEAAVHRWLATELQRAYFDFAPAGASHAPRARYRVPFDPTVPRLVSQGPGGEISHQGEELHAVDFIMRDGTEVRAARGGVVGRVVDGFTEGGTEERFRARANVVHVLHPDGTFGTYAHLAPGIPVEPGQRVRVGQPLGRSGSTGYTRGPHLHFVVSRVLPDGIHIESVPIRFGGGAGIAPETGAWLGAPPRPNLDLALFVDGEPTRPDTFVPVRWGQRVRVRVETRPRGGGPARDVTAHPRLELVSMTPWSARVVGPGEVELAPLPGFEHVERPDAATVSVFYVNRPARQIGLGKIEFEVRHERAQAADAPR